VPAKPDVLEQLGETTLILQICLVVFPSSCRAQLLAVLVIVATFANAGLLAQEDADDTGHPATVFNHAAQAPWWVGGQMNFIFQANPSFPARYSGGNSFGPDGGQALSRVLTLYTAARVNRTTDLIVHLETAGGTGLNNGAGLGGPPNLDVVRNPTLTGKVYVARAMIRHIVGLSAEEHASDAGPFSAVPALPERRIEIRAGRFSTVDVFDLNAVGSDSHLQFMNWAIDNNGAYDYAADTRGYTFGVVVEYDAPRWTLRFGEGLMPTKANGIVLDWHVTEARGENVEVEIHRSLVPGRDGRLRFLGYLNHAQMGTYSEALAACRPCLTVSPDIVQTRKPGTIKYGAGLNLDQTFGRGVRGFMRAGWDDGHTETFAYTEVDRTIAGGADTAGAWWHRAQDKLGVAVAVNGLAAPHREYLALGGSGFQLGDGGLSYGHETILETYYTVSLIRGVFASIDGQRIANPGFNRDRGPILVGSVRLHIDF
jgi:high affinity Mn2+ porin